MDFYTNDLTISYDRHKEVVKDLNLSIPPGKITSLVGANGCGKSTILKTIARIIKPDSGNVILDGKKIHGMQTRAVSKKLTILPQGPESPEGLTVEDLVGYGRIPYKNGFNNLTNEDNEIIDWALSVTKMADFKDRTLDQLSGGQRQRAWIAMAVAQTTELLLLDEPTTYLDMAHQLEVLNLIRHLNKEFGRTIVMVIHDLNQAALYSDYIIAIKNGKIVQEGKPKDVITVETCEEVFGIKADILTDSRTGTPLCHAYDLCGSHEIMHLLEKQVTVRK